MFLHKAFFLPMQFKQVLGIHANSNSTCTNTSAANCFFRFLFAYDKIYRKPNQSISNHLLLFHNHLKKIRSILFDLLRKEKLGMNATAYITEIMNNRNQV